jgi:hypothetical protein
LKSITILSLAILLVSVVFISVVSAKAPVEDSNGIDVEQSPYLFLLKANDEEKVILFSYIDNCSISDKEKEKMKKEMKSIWARYPDKITKKDNVTLEEISKATAQYLNNKYKDNIGAQWTPDTHKKIISVLLKNINTPDSYVTKATSGASDPDYWDYGSDPFKKFWQSYNHYYNPNLFSGSAPSNCQNYINKARDCYKNGDYLNAYYNLGIASHFMSDVGNPMHTGNERNQYDHQWVHYAYEDYVFKNWDTGYNYKIYCSTWSGYTTTNPKNSVIELSKKTNPYVYTLFDKIYYHQSTFGSDPEVISITRKSMTETGMYDMALIKYMKS